MAQAGYPACFILYIANKPPGMDGPVSWSYKFELEENATSGA